MSSVYKIHDIKVKSQTWVYILKRKRDEQDLTPTRDTSNWVTLEERSLPDLGLPTTEGRRFL